MNDLRRPRSCLVGTVMISMLVLAGCGRLAGGPTLGEVQQTLEKGDLNTAAVQLHNLLEKEPGSAEALMLMARTQLLLGELGPAATSLSEARAAGADAAAIAELDARLRLEGGRFEDLLAWLEADGSMLDPEQRLLYKGRALLGLGRVPESLAVFEGFEGPLPDDDRLHVYMSQAHATFGRWPLARQQLKLARQADPSMPLAWLHTGLLALRDSDQPAARDAFRKAAELSRDHLTLAERSLALGSEMELLLEQGETEAAGAVHDQLAQLMSQSPLTELLGARISLASGEAQAAVSRLDRLVLAQPELPAARIALVTALIANEQLERAAQELGQLRSRDAVSPAVNAAQSAIKAAASSAQPARTLSLTRALMLLDEPRAAQVTLERALAQHPNDRPLQVALVQVLMKRDRNADALSRAEVLAKQNPEDPAVQTVLGQARLVQRDFAGAAAAFSRAMQREPTSSLAIELAMAEQQAGQGDPLKTLASWLEREPADITARLVLADLQSRHGLEDAAIASYETALAAHPRHAAALNNLAILYQKRGDPRALATARAAHEVAPASSEIADTYGWLLAKAGQPGAAVPLLEKAVRLNPALPEIRFHLAAAWIKRGEPGDVVRARLWLVDLLRDPAKFDGREDSEKLLGTL